MVTDGLTDGRRVYTARCSTGAGSRIVLHPGPLTEYEIIHATG